MTSSTRTRDIEVLADGMAFLEGPRWHAGRLYVSDFYLHNVYAFEPGGGLELLCEVPGQPSGLGFDADGRLLVVSMTDRRLLRLENGTLQEVADLSLLAPFHCNDLLVDARGRAYVGNFGWDATVDASIRSTVLIRVDRDGSTTVVAEDLVFPNGSVLTPDGRTLLISETFAGRVSAFDVADDGSLAGRRIWAHFARRAQWETIDDAVASGLTLPDGMALDHDGAIWIGDASGSGALRVAEGGKILDIVPTGDLAVYAVALGGEDRRTLYMCASPPLLQTDPSTEHRAALLACRVDVAGTGRP